MPGNWVMLSFPTLQSDDHSVGMHPRSFFNKIVFILNQFYTVQIPNPFMLNYSIKLQIISDLRSKHLLVCNWDVSKR